MSNQKQAIERVISSIDWKKIKSYHTKLGIKWEYEEDKQVRKRVPTVPELRSELHSILYHMLEQRLDYISHGSWIVFWEHDAGDMRVVFRLADFTFEDYIGAKENLEEALKLAIEKEEYEKAALIRDEINNIKKNANNNIE